jgi:hypothetical protein
MHETITIPSCTFVSPVAFRIRSFCTSRQTAAVSDGTGEWQNFQGAGPAGGKTDPAHLFFSGL